MELNTVVEVVVSVVAVVAVVDCMAMPCMDAADIHPAAL